ncbi:MAG: hypothetical protein RL642_95, partial [Bacteroidota bacterium]
MVLTIINVVLLALYRMVIGRANRILMLLPYYKSSSTSTEKVTVIIPARNEEANIGRCLDSLLQQSLPTDQREIIVVDDGSTDTTATLVESYAEKGVRLLTLTDEAGGKKAALAKGIAAAKHGIIVTTDADCTYPANWLNTLLNYRFEHDAVFV